MCRPSVSWAVCPARTINDPHFSAKSETVIEDTAMGFGACRAGSTRRVKSVGVGSRAADSPAGLCGDVMSRHVQRKTYRRPAQFARVHLAPAPRGQAH